MVNNQDLLRDIFKAHAESSVERLLVSELKKIAEVLGLQVKGKKKFFVKAIVNAIGKDQFATTTASNDVEVLKEKIGEFLVRVEEEEELSEEESDEADQNGTEGQDSGKRKREDELLALKDEVKKLKGDCELLVARLCQQQSEKNVRDELMSDFAIDAEVRKYTDSIYTQLPSTNTSLLAEYDNLKKNSTAAMKLSQTFPEHEGAKKLVSNLEGRALQLQIQAVNPKLAFIDSNPLWIQNIDKIKLAEKLVKYESGSDKGEKSNYYKAFNNAKTFEKKEKSSTHTPRTEEKEYRKKKCFNCGDPNHLIKDCPKKNKHESSDYLKDKFFRGSRRKKRGYSLYIQQMERMGIGKRFGRNNIYVERWCWSPSGRYFRRILWKSRFKQVAYRGKRMVGERNNDFERDRSCGAMYKPQSSGKVSTDTKERLIPIDNRSQTFESLLFGPEIQVQHVKEISRTRTKDKSRRYHQLKVKEEDRPYFAIQVGSEILQFTVLPFGWNGSPYYFTQMMNAFMELLKSESLLPSNYLDDVEQSKGVNELLKTWCYNREKEESVNPIESISIVGNSGGSRKQKIVYVGKYLRKDSDSNFDYIVEMSPEYCYNIKTSVSSDRYNCSLHGLFSASEGDVESSLLLCGRANQYFGLGFRILFERQQCGAQFAMDSIQLRPLEWTSFPISQSCGIFLDGCFENRMGSISQREKFETARFLEGRSTRGTHQCLRGKSDLFRPKRMGKVVGRKESDYLYRFESSFILCKERKSEIPSHEPISATNMAYHFRTRHPFAFVEMVAFGGKPDSGLPPLDRTSSELVLRTFQLSRKSTPALSRIQGRHGIGTPSLEKEVVVEPNREISSSIYVSKWEPFQRINKRKPGTMQEIMGYKSNVDRLQSKDLSRIADSLMSCSIEMSTSDTYFSYWNRFIKFVIKEKENPPPTSEMVVRFITKLFIKTPSGNNCRSAKFAVKHFCKMIGWEDPTISVRVNSVIKGMVNLSSVASKRERDPWRIDFIKKWIQVGKQFVNEKAYVLYTCLMIFGIRSMFRGNELGGLLLEDVKVVEFPVVGFSLTARKVKNNKQGRRACIESTGSELCPLRWLMRLLATREKGIFLFAGSFAMNTVEISFILTKVATWINADPGKYSSHSLRIGGATEASVVGIPETTIKAMGGWNSDAIDRYFRANFNGSRNGSRLMGF